MRRAARVLGWATFAVTLVGVGTITWAMLSIRSPLPGGGVAAGAEPTAYLIVALAVAGGAAAAGLIVAWLAELLLRAAGR